MKRVYAAIAALAMAGAVLVVGALPAEAIGTTAGSCSAGGAFAGRSTSQYAESWRDSAATECKRAMVRASYSQNGQPGYTTSWKYGTTYAKVSPGGVRSGTHRTESMCGLCSVRYS